MAGTQAGQRAGSRHGGAERLYAAARACKEYIGGTLTDTRLWPWKMGQRIKEARIASGLSCCRCRRAHRAGLGRIRRSGSAPSRLIRQLSRRLTRPRRPQERRWRVSRSRMCRGPSRLPCTATTGGPAMSSSGSHPPHCGISGTASRWRGGSTSVERPTPGEADLAYLDAVWEGRA